MQTAFRIVSNILQTIYDDSRKRRVVIIQGDDALFGFVEEKFSDDPQEMIWIPVSKRNSYCGTMERALAEARGRIDWLAEKQS
jgi:hypothetical protein